MQLERARERERAGMSRFRIIAITLAVLSAAFNVLAAYLFHQLPEDPRQVAWGFAMYSHLGSVLALLGVIGGVREHAFSLAVFANYFLVDTVVCSIPRFLALYLVSGVRDHLCSPDLILQPTILAYHPSSSSAALASTTASFNAYKDEYRADEVESSWGQPGSGWSERDCRRVLWVVQAAAFVAVVGVTFVKFVFALQVREYALRLLKRGEGKSEREEEKAALGEKGRRKSVEKGWGGKSLI